MDKDRTGIADPWVWDFDFIRPQGNKQWSKLIGKGLKGTDDQISKKKFCIFTVILLSFEPTFEKNEAHFFSEIFSCDLEKLVFRILTRNCLKARVLI